MGLIITLVLAGIVGWLASLVMKTDSQMGTVANVVVGLIGGFVGTFLLGWIAPATPTDNGFSLIGIIVGVVGACIAIWVYQALD